MSSSAPRSDAAPRPRVLHVSQSTTVYGAEMALLRLAPNLEQRGFECLLASPPEGDLAARWRELGMEHVALPFPVHLGLRRSDGTGRPGPLQLAREGGVVGQSAVRVAKAIRQAKADLVHTHSLAAYLETAIAGRLTRCPVVLDIHDLVVPGAGRKVLDLSVRLATRTVAITEACASCVSGKARERVSIVVYGMDLERFSPGPADPAVRAALGATESNPLVGIVGRVDPSKGIDVLVEAMDLLVEKHPDARLAVVGGPLVAHPGYAEELEATAKRLLGDRVTFTGPRSDGPAIYRALDVLVNASSAEPLGLTILEAQATAVPVIVSRGGGAPEVVDDGTTGFVVSPRDPGELAAALDKLLASPELHAQMGAAGREFALRRFDPGRQADEMIAVYRSARGDRS